MYPLNELKIPKDIAQQNGPFEEFKQDVSIVTVELENGNVFERVMLLYPNYVISVAEKSELPFNPSDVILVTQEKSEYRKFKDSTWCFWYDHNQVVQTHNKLFKQDKIQLAVFVPQHFSQLNFAP